MISRRLGSKASRTVGDRKLWMEKKVVGGRPKKVQFVLGCDDNLSTNDEREAHKMLDFS